MYARALYPLLLLIFSSFAISPAVNGQVVLEGEVVDHETGEPLVGAHVFISETMQGAVTEPDGSYTIDGALPGFHRLYASMMGYKPLSIDTLLQSGERYEIDIRLEPDVIDVGEITVEDERDSRWQGRYERFVENFIGLSSHSEEVRLLNPEALRFSTTWWGRLNAEAVEPLIIENYYLGYRLTYHLEEFEDTRAQTRWDGEPHFEEMVPRDSAEAERWAQNRERTYKGSFRHFILSLWDDSLSEEEFIARRVEHQRTGFQHTGRRSEWPVIADHIWRDVDAEEYDADYAEEEIELRQMRFRGVLRITYMEQESSDEYMRWEGRRIGAHSSNQRSYIELNEPYVTIDETGEIKETYGLTRYGYFAFERIAALLPKEYRPDDEQ